MIARLPCFLVPIVRDGLAATVGLLLLAGGPWAAAQPSCDNCILENGWPSSGSTTESVEQAPQVYDEPGGDGIVGTADDDLRPPKGAYAIDNGKSSNWSGRDINGRSIEGEASDIGPFESYGSALPVELAGFSATLAEGAVRLSWTTASETGNAAFRVQRKRGAAGSEAGGDWNTIGRKQGAGTTAEPRTYQFTDENLPYDADRLRYRLVQVDADGTTHPTEPVTIRRSAPTRLRLLSPHPNPVRSTVTLRYALPEGPSAGTARLTVYDVLGRRVASRSLAKKPGRHEVRLDVRGWAGGPYFARLRTATSTREVRFTVVR